MIGMVGIEINLDTRITEIRFAKQWSRDNMSVIPHDVKKYYSKIKWDTTYADQLVGQHILKSIEYEADLSIFAINTQKNIKEPEEEEGMKRMDLIEMTQFLLSLKQVHKIQYPKGNRTGDMQQLINQTEMFTENISEQGTVNYYAPGNEFDCLIKSLMICCFAGRPFIEEAQMPFMIVYGENTKSQAQDMQETVEELLKKKKANPLVGYTPGILK